MELICKICQRDFDTREKVLGHVKNEHLVSFKHYVIDYEYAGFVPLCQCGCGGSSIYNKAAKNYTRFVPGHQCRDPEIRQQMIVGGREAAADPVKREKNSISNKKKWAEPEYYASQLPAKRERWIKILKKNHIDPVVRQHMSEGRKAAWASPAGDEHRKILSSQENRDKISVGTKLALSDPKIRQFLSDHACKLVEQGIIGPNQTIRTWIVDPVTDRNIRVDSNWELWFFTNAIKNGIMLQRDHGIRIPYEFDGKRQYIPDFFDPITLTIYEIKGRENDGDPFKYEAARKFVALKEWNYVLIKDKITVTNYFDPKEEKENE